MKIIPALCALTFISAQAADVSYSLDFNGDSISKSLIRNNHIDDKNDISEIKRVLELNNMNWEDAKRLPIGKVYYVDYGMAESSTPEDMTANKIEKNVAVVSTNTENKVLLEVGTFHHTQSLNKANVYSDLSQYVLASYEMNKSYGVNLKLERYQYSNDDDQNIASEKVQTNYDVSALKLFNYKSFKLNIGAYTKSLLTFDLDSLNRVEFESGASTGIEAGASSEFYQKGDISVFAGLKVQKNASGSNIEDYQGAQINSGLNFKYLKRDMSLVVRYEFSQMEIDSESLGERKASLGLNTIF
jgi:hypothetical protein